MDTVIVASSQFYSHYPKRIPKGTVNAEAVLIRLDSEWEGLTVRTHWLNVASGVEKVVLLERDQPNTIPWEVLTDLGELRMGLDGMDGGTIVKPTVWLTYGYVVDGVDPEAGDDPQPPTPSWEQQMVEQATQANQAAQAAQKAAEEAAESVASAGPYADEAKKSAEAAKASQDAAATSARQANEAAQTAQNAAGSIGDAVKRAEDAATAAGTAQQAAEAAQGAAARSAETAHGAATTANQAAQESNSAATKAGQYLTSVESAAKEADSARDQATTAATTAQGAAQAAASARDQATTAATTAQDHATAASTAKDAAEQAAATAGSAQSGAAQSAQTAASSASAAQAAQQAAEAAAAVLPKPTQEDAGKVPVAQPDGSYLLEDIAVSDPNTGQDELIYKATTEKEAQFISTPSLTGKGYRIIRAILGTPVTDIRNEFTIARIYINGKNKDIYMPAVPSSSASRLSVRFSLSESGVVEYQCSGTRNQGDLGTPSTSNPFSSVSQAYGSFLIDGISAIEIQRVDLIAYMSDNVWPVGTNIIFTGEA